MTALSPGRVAALDTLVRQAGRFPDLDFAESADASAPAGAPLDPRDAALGRAIEQAVIRRWLTLAAICRACIDRRWENVDRRIQAALLTGAAQLLLFGHQADHAVVDDTVEWTKRKGRSGAPGFVNAVLRRIAALRGEVLPAGDPGAAPAAWLERCDTLPLEDGRVLMLTRPVFSPDHVARLGEQTSHGEDLVLHWMNTAGRATAIARAVHGLVHPPVVLAGLGAAAAGAASAAGAGTDGGPLLAPHREPGFWVWRGTHRQLLELLAAHPEARVQDAGTGRAVLLAAGLRPALILDACAGRGTKTRQIALLHPNAEIVATDADAGRLRTLAEAFAGHPQVKVTTPEGLRRVVGRCDLLLLDVPCSNTGVLARRPEARYRFTRARLDGLVALQRRIALEHTAFLAPGGHVLYSTCSLENAENSPQAEGLARRLRGRVEAMEAREPSGRPGEPDTTYADGTFGALVKAG